MIAKKLDLSPNTIKYHIKKVYEKLGVSSRVELNNLIHRGHL